MSKTPAITYQAATWEEFLALPAKRSGGVHSDEARAAIRVAIDLQPGRVVRVVGHTCRITGASWGCGIAISVRNAGVRRGYRFKIRHSDGELWIARPPESANGDTERLPSFPVHVIGVRDRPELELDFPSDLLPPRGKPIVNSFKGASGAPA